jgi:serine/threonine-protein kinase RsbW
MQDVEIRIHASPAHLSVVRTVATTMATRANFDPETVADVKLAVDEACSLLIGRAVDGAEIRCRCHVDFSELRFNATVLSRSVWVPEPSSLCWRLISALSHSALTWVERLGVKRDGARTAGQLLHVELRRRRVNVT